MQTAQEFEKSIEKSWRDAILDELELPYIKSLKNFLIAERKKGIKVFPSSENYFSAFSLTPIDKVRVVILGQDPYHGEGQAQGLSFSVPQGFRLPPSLRNIYKELHSDLGIPPSKNGCLNAWARQGVLLLNSVLSVREGAPGSHQKQGWETLTDRIVRELSNRREGLVFLLWGAYAIKKGSVIDRSKHLVIDSVHPSPLSASRGFFGSRPFSKINSYLRDRGEPEIDWRVS